MALRALEPAFSPTTTRLVFFDTESVTLAPSSSARALAASRVMVDSSPVKTTILSLSGASSATTRRVTASTVSCLRRSLMISTLCPSLKKAHIASAVVTPICSTLHSRP